MSKHTPGPWKAGERIKNKPTLQIAVTRDAPEGYSYAIAWAVRSAHIGITGTDEANARLIAAAPELKDACILANGTLEILFAICGEKVMQEIFKEDLKDVRLVMRRLAAAIAKAEGRHSCSHSFELSVDHKKCADCAREGREYGL